MCFVEFWSKHRRKYEQIWVSFCLRRIVVWKRTSMIRKSWIHNPGFQFAFIDYKWKPCKIYSSNFFEAVSVDSSNAKLFPTCQHNLDNLHYVSSCQLTTYYSFTLVCIYLKWKQSTTYKPVKVMLKLKKLFWIEVTQNQLVDLTKSVNLKAKNTCYVVK